MRVLPWAKPIVVIEMPAIQLGESLPSSLAVLIEVPAIRKPAKASRRRPGRHDAASDRTGDKLAVENAAFATEVRLAGCALLALVPIVSACTLGWSSRPNRILACSISDPLEAVAMAAIPPLRPVLDSTTKAGRPQVISSGRFSCSRSSRRYRSRCRGEVPVIFPGFVLPDDSREDLPHEGS